MTCPISPVTIPSLSLPKDKPDPLLFLKMKGLTLLGLPYVLLQLINVRSVVDLLVRWLGVIIVCICMTPIMLVCLSNKHHKTVIVLADSAVRHVERFAKWIEGWGR